MDVGTIGEISKHSLYIAIKVSLPILAVALGVGLIISLFQALTQIQEATLSFVPKIVAIMFAMIFFGPYIFAMLQDLFMLAIEHIATG